MMKIEVSPAFRAGMDKAMDRLSLAIEQASSGAMLADKAFASLSFSYRMNPPRVKHPGPIQRKGRLGASGRFYKALLWRMPR